jgi:asparagine synthase (glutamine-hydrolysing)
MCGIVGYFNLQAPPEASLRLLERMIWSLRHRGPDGFGFFQDEQIGLAHARLSIIDLEGGWQPICNEDKSIWVIFNGEIFNYIELREQLVRQGHRFTTSSDTEVLVHLYEEKGADFVKELNGQFAIALYDTRNQSLLLARDRMGIRPLFYCLHRGRCYFGSEIKAIFSADSALPRHLDSQVLQDIFTFWSPVGADTIFKGVLQVQPGHTLLLSRQGLGSQQKYWDIDYHAPVSAASQEELAEELRALLIDSVRLQLRADVPVGAYLSGGLDSSTITSIIRHYTNNPLRTFSVVFEDEVYDERHEQAKVIEYLQTDHDQVVCSYATIAEAFPAVMYHAETPILRTAPTPLYLLSGLVRQHNYKVVLTGEGADEILGGYDLFKEAKVRAFIAAQPDSACRSMLLKRLYPYLALSPTRSASYAKQFFATDVNPEADLFYGHQPRWKNGQFLTRFLTDDCKKVDYSPLNKATEYFSGQLKGINFFTRAQYVESKLLLANYLLSSQGDRMGMAHSVEGRFPFLDHRVVEFAARIPVHLKMKGLNEKYLLKKAMRDLLPPEIVDRKKQPYMAPDIPSFFGAATPSYVEHLLAPESLKKSGLFNTDMVSNLVEKCRVKARQGFRENMALVGVLSTQCLHDQFIENWREHCPETLPNTRRIID